MNKPPVVRRINVLEVECPYCRRRWIPKLGRIPRMCTACHHYFDEKAVEELEKGKGEPAREEAEEATEASS